MNKREEVFLYLKKGYKLSSAEAFKKFGATRLSAIIFDLREKYNIGDIWEEDIDRYGNKVRFKKYFYIGRK